jgi:hypothetical protein
VAYIISPEPIESPRFRIVSEYSKIFLIIEYFTSFKIYFNLKNTIFERIQY